MSNNDRMLFIVEISLGVYFTALCLGYGWVRAIHYPFTLRQRKMWTYYVLFASALPVLTPLCMAMGLWIITPKQSAAVTIFLLFVWIIFGLFIVRHMSRPGGRLSEER